VTVFCLFHQHVCHNKFLTRLCTANENIEALPVNLYNGNSIKSQSLYAPGQNNTMVGQQKLSLRDTAKLDNWSLTSAPTIGDSADGKRQGGTERSLTFVK
jgi:hypothetical protein